MNDVTTPDLFPRLTELNQIGIALSREKDINRLLEAILVAAKKITNADGGTLYRMHRDRSCASRSCAPTRWASPWAAPPASRSRITPVQLYDEDGRPNNSMVVAYSVLHDQHRQHRRRLHRAGFRFLRHQELRPQDRLSLAVLPHGADEEPRGRDHRRAAAHQRQGSRDRRDRAVLRRPTSNLAESLASQAAVALTNRLLINQLEELFESFIKSDQRRDRRQVALHRRPLPARARRSP